MGILEFTALPLPHYINSGYSLAGPGRRHPERVAVGEFDLLVVKQGCLYIGEEDRQYEVSEGHALILRPDLHHYPTEGCRETTASFWTHFHTLGSWRMAEDEPAESPEEEEGSRGAVRTFRMQTFQMKLPQFTRLDQPTKMYERLQQLNALERDSHLDAVRWKQQILFQDVLSMLSATLSSRLPRQGSDVADQAASFLRAHYMEQVSARDLGLALNFHPVYIARCMQKQFGCSPMEYLLRYRLEQAKYMLLQTDLPIHQIALEVGFQQAAYFTSCFGKWEGLTPREYRQRFAAQG